MKKLLVWLAKKFITRDHVKAAIHEANMRLAKKEASERTAQIMDIGNDVSEVTATYLSAYAGDGKMDDAERTRCDAACDKMIDKYITEERFDAFLAAL